jgi:LPXTG-motif cell wall-anchored protein
MSPTVKPTPAASSTPVAVGLPVTGPGNTGLLVGVGAVLLLGGGLLVAFLRRRRVRFIA